MTLKGTIVFVVLAISLMVWLLFFAPTPRQRLDDPLFHGDFNKITTITIMDGNETHTLQRDDNGWEIETTPPDRADLQEVTRLITALQEIKPLDILRQRELKKDLSLASLGLQNPKRSLTIHEDGAKDQILTFGNEAVGEKRLFARINSSNDVFIISSKLAEIAFRPNDDFRNHFLTSLQFKELEQIRLHQGLGEFQSVFKNGHWVMTQPTKAPLSKNAMKEWIEPLLRAPVQIRVDNDESNLSTYGLDQPRAEITLVSENLIAPVVLSLGKRIEDKDHPENTSVYVRSSRRRSIFKMSADVEKIFMISPDELRNRQFFQLNLDTVDRIIITKGTESTSLRRQADASDDWISDGEFATIITGKKMQAMIESLEQTAVIRFQRATPENLATMGLKRPLGPTRRIRFIAHLSENTPDEQAGDFVVLEILFGIISSQAPSDIFDRHLSSNPENSQIRPFLESSDPEKGQLLKQEQPDKLNRCFARIEDTPDVLEIPASVMELPIWKIGFKE